MKVELKIDGEHFDNRKLYTVILGDDETEIDTLVTFNPDMVDSWIANALAVNKCRLDRLIVGLDIEWNPRGSDHSVATLQLCVGGYCLIYQIYHATEISNDLRDFLQDPDFTFVGVGIKADVKKLWNDYLLEVVNTRDLCPWAADELGMEELRRVGLKRLVKEVVGEEMDKPRSVTCSRWNSRVLSREQVAYACLDAYFSFEIGRRLSAWY